MEKTCFFGGTAYLSMPFNEKFKALVFEGVERYGINFGASRNNNVTLDVFGLAEAHASKQYRTEDAIIVSSGYLAAQLVVQHLLGQYQFLYAPETHPSLWIGNPKPPTLSFSVWSEQVVGEVNRSDMPVLIITNSLNNLFPEIYEFEWLNHILPGKKVCLLVDDSHGIGITGKYGEGVYSRISKHTQIDTVVIASMAKAIGVDAGVILGTRKIISQLRKSPVYAGASPPSPALLWAYMHARSIHQEELEKLRENMKFFASLIENNPAIYYLKDIPVYLINDPKSGKYLFEQHRILISSFSYPDPQGEVLNRVVLNSGHTKEEIRRLAEAIFLLNPNGRTGSQN